MRKILLIILIAAAAVNARDPLRQLKNDHSLRDTIEAGMKRVEALCPLDTHGIITADCSACFYDEKHFAWEFNGCGYFTLKGQFEPQTGKIVNLRQVRIGDGTLAAAQDLCEVQPEWGKDYVDQKCVESKKEKAGQLAQKHYERLQQKSVYRQCHKRIND